jgi:hypothetical protein
MSCDKTIVVVWTVSHMALPPLVWFDVPPDASVRPGVWWIRLPVTEELIDRMLFDVRGPAVEADGVSMKDHPVGPEGLAQT